MHLDALIQQKSDEHIVYVLRRDPVTFIPRILLFLLLIIMPAILYALLAAKFPALAASVPVHAAVIVFGSMYLLSVILFFYASFTIFYLDVSIITNDRIVDVEQLGLFSRRVAEFDLIRIQDVTTDIQGFFASIFNYGDVIAKTASTNIHLVFANVNDPNKIREDIIRLSQLDKETHRTAESQ